MEHARDESIRLHCCLWLRPWTRRSRRRSFRLSERPGLCLSAYPAETRGRRQEGDQLSESRLSRVIWA
jgi:hypothetical protein